MKKTIYYTTILATLACGCTTVFHKQTVIHDSGVLHSHIGKQVILIGELVDHKRPAIHGVLVGHRKAHTVLPVQDPQPEDLANYLTELTSNHAVVYRKVSARGVLVRVCQEGADLFSLSQTTNVWYELIDPQTHNLADYEVIEE